MAPAGAPPPASPGLPVFARRKRTPFKGPMMMMIGGQHHGSSPGGRSREGSLGQAGGSRSGSVQGRRSGEVIAEEDEEELMEEEEEEEVEEVDAFSPVEAGDFVEIQEEGVGTVANGEVLMEEGEGEGEEDTIQGAVDKAAQKVGE